MQEYFQHTRVIDVALLGDVARVLRRLVVLVPEQAALGVSVKMAIPRGLQ